MTNGAALVMPLTADGYTVVGRRRADLAFLGGFTVFPGGAIDVADAAHAAGLGLDADGPARVAAIRELFEETGLVVHGDRLAPASSPSPGASIEDAYAALGLSLADAARRLQPVARWVTPSFSPIRFDTTCFLLPLETAAAPIHGSGELEALERVSPRALLDAWRAFRILLAPPTWAALQVMSDVGPDLAQRFAALDGARGQDVRYTECIPGIRSLPLRTPTLPPAIHTNTYLMGTGRLLVIDPGTYEESERAALLEEIERLGRPVEAIVLTHHHGDHTGSATWLAARTGAPIAAHRITAELVAPGIRVTRLLMEGDTLELGLPGAPFPVHVTFTPGHARGHIVLSDGRPGSRAHVVGDMVASVGTIVIDPPDGDMAEYLRQLARLRARGDTILFPAHGMPIVDGAAKLDHYVAHRLGREAKVRSALEAFGGPARTAELVPTAYADTPEFLWPLAERSCLAHLLKLVEDGVARRDGDTFAGV